MDKIEQRPYLEVPALRVNQPLGTFYVAAISAKHLLAISYSEPLKYIDAKGNVKGTQRVKDSKRLKEIGQYIDSVEMAFPNSIILAANYAPTGQISKNESERWIIKQLPGENLYSIVIPTNAPLAAIIDGQHRLSAFEYVTNPERFDNLQLLCSIYFDLPNSYQAFLFATINSNQKKVDRSLALEQFGYNVNDEAEKCWTPEKLGVFLSRKLNLDKSSPFYHHIKVAPLNVDQLFDGGTYGSWVVSTATIVDGICNLISSNVKRDRIMMQQTAIFSGRNRAMLKEVKDVSPLRKLFLDEKDQTIYDVVSQFFQAVGTIIWQKATDKSYIIKTVGIQGLFDVLKLILNVDRSKDPSTIDFKPYLLAAAHIDFSDKFFQASGIGRSRIKNVIALASGLIQMEKVKKTDTDFYGRLLNGSNTLSGDERMFWGDEAENAVLNALQNANWNYENSTVSLVQGYNLNDSELFNSKSSLVQRLEQIAEESFANSLPEDPDYAALQRENFDSKDLVRVCLADYEENLKNLGWNG